MLQFSFGSVVPSNPESVFLAQDSLCMAEQIGAFDVVTSERGWENRSSGCALFLMKSEIFQGMICTGCTRVYCFFNNVCS